MSTTAYPTTLSDKAQAVAIRNRLQRDLAELTNAAKGADRLIADEEGKIFDVVCHLSGSLDALRSAIVALNAYVEQAN